MVKRAVVTVIGTSHMDFIAYLDRFPEPGETVIGKGFVSAPGGKGANQAIAACRLGADCHLISKVGADFVGESLLGNARGNGVRIDHVTRDPRSHSGVALIYVSAKGENMIAVAPGVDLLISEDDVKAAEGAIASSNAVLAQLEIPTKTATFAIEYAKCMGKTTILNPAPASGLDDSVLRHIDYMTPNRGELAKLTGMRVDDDRSITDAARDLVDMGLRAMVVTLGRRGAMVVTPSGNELVPSYNVNAVDTVGAGDAFNGALAVAISMGCEVGAAVRFANLVAALKITRRGAQAGLPTLKEVVDFARSRGIEDVPQVFLESPNGR